jgi:hypothetical protein
LKNVETLYATEWKREFVSPNGRKNVIDKKTWVVLQNNNKKKRGWLVAFKDE